MTVTTEWVHVHHIMLCDALANSKSVSADKSFLLWHGTSCDAFICEGKKVLRSN